MKDQNHHAEQLPDHLKDLSQELKQQFTHIEQEPPNKPSFLLVVLLTGVAIIIIFILAIFVLHLDGGRLFNRHPKHPHSQLILPSPQDHLAARSPNRLTALERFADHA